MISFHLKDLKFEAQQWKLMTVAFVTCPELGPELELFERGHMFSHFRSDTECMDSVQPVMTAYSNNHPKGTTVKAIFTLKLVWIICDLYKPLISLCFVMSFNLDFQ